ncbi:hypothetical protein [Halobellus ordinarius]|nr:hypothetical protein [Halobellus sp. ZY16]
MIRGVKAAVDDARISILFPQRTVDRREGGEPADAFDVNPVESAEASQD